MYILDESGVTVQVTRKISVGQTLRINPSEAFLGIESGIIKVGFIGTIEQIAGNDVHNSVTPQVEAEYDAMVDLDPDSKERLDTGLWVVYTYHRNDDIATLPLEEFIDHTMSY